MILPTATDVVKAAGHIAPFITRTPILRAEALDAAVGARVHVKAECLQATGSFKLRGATNRLLQIPEAERVAGVVAFSSGNHAQGVARAAARLGMPALIVMPFDAPEVKIAGVRADGAQIHFYDRLTESREEIAADIAHKQGAVLVPSYDDVQIIAGQGTAALELIEDLDVPLDHYVCCAGGGGLLAGAALAFEAKGQGTHLYSAEPIGFDDHKRSFEAGRRVAVTGAPISICDAILTPIPGEITFAINASRVAGGFAVSDDEVRAAMAFAFRHLKVVVEPGGAAALAAVLYHLPTAWRGAEIGLILSGGNVDPTDYADILSGLNRG